MQNTSGPIMQSVPSLLHATWLGDRWHISEMKPTCLARVTAEGEAALLEARLRAEFATDLGALRAELGRTPGGDQEHAGVEAAERKATRPPTQAGDVAWNAVPSAASSSVAKDEESAVAAEESGEPVELEPSMWNAPLLIGTSAVGCAGSAQLLLLMALNVAVQAVFASIVATNLSRRTIDGGTVDQLRTWRRFVAHDVQYYNALSQRSLASRVCSSDAGLEMSSGQANMYTMLVSYLGDGDGSDGMAHSCARSRCWSGSSPSAVSSTRRGSLRAPCWLCHAALGRRRV